MRGSVEARGIRLATLNIRQGRAGGLEAALRALQQGNVNVGVLKETNLRDGMHAQQGAGYTIWATVAESMHQGGILVVWREDAGWQVEGIINFVPSMVIFLLISRSRKWYVVEAYVPPNNAPAAHCMEQALEAPQRECT